MQVFGTSTKELMGPEWENMYYKYVELHTVVNCQEFWRKQEDQGSLSFERSKGQRNRCLRSGQRAADPNKVPTTAGSLGNPSEEPDGCAGRRTETHRANMWAQSPATSDV